MVNEQIKTILNKLDGLTQENPDLVANGISIEQFINECKDNNSPLSAIVNCLLETIREKDEEISKQNQTITNFQAQTQGIYTRLRRKGGSEEGVISPLVASPTGFFDRPSPRKRFASYPNSQTSSPVHADWSMTSSPHSVDFSTGGPSLNMPEWEETIGAREEELNNLRQQVSLLQTKLEQKDKAILNLETERQDRIQQQETEDHQKKALQSQASQVQSEAKQHQAKINQLERELKETNDDYYQLGQQKDRLKEIVQEAKATNKRLEEELEKEAKENQCLKEAQNKTNKQLFDKFKELRLTKKLANEEKIALQQIINDQTKKYQEESQARESEHRKKMEHLMLLQVADRKITHWKNPAWRRYNSQSISLPVTPRGSYYGDNKDGSDLFFELNQRESGSSVGNYFGNQLSNSPANEKDDPFVASGNGKGRKSTSLIFNQKPTPDPETQNLEEIWNEVADLVEDKIVQQEETSHQREEVLLAEIKALKDNQAHLENSWKTLKDDYDILEKTLVNLRSQQLVEENNRQKLQEKVNELEYKLAEAQTHKFRLEKEAKDESTAELVAERDQLKERLTTVQNKLDGMYSENAKLAMQKLSEVNRVYEKVRAIEAQLQKEQEDNQNTKIQNQKLLNEIAELKKNNDLSKIGNSIDKLGSATERAKNALDLLKSQIEVDINKK